MQLIDANAKIVAQLYDSEYEDWIQKEMTVADYLSFSDTSIPFVDAVPVAHGKWENIGGYGYQYRCSKCVMCAGYKTAYCPNRGAKMDGGAK